MPLNGLAGKTVIVTGAAQGIGRAYARRFRDEGCRVVLADLNADKGRGVLAELTDAGPNAIFCTTDVSSETSCKQMVDEALKAFGHVDVLINNAAIFSTIQMKPFWEMSVAEWDGLMAVNLKGVWLAGKACSAPMREQKSGSIVNISSAAYLLARPGYAHYMASKAGVLGLTRAMARELGEFGVRVNAITPGPCTRKYRARPSRRNRRKRCSRCSASGATRRHRTWSAWPRSWLRTMPGSSPARRSTATADSRSSS